MNTVDILDRIKQLKTKKDWSEGKDYSKGFIRGWDKALEELEFWLVTERGEEST